MKTKRYKSSDMTLEAFADKHGLVMEVRDRGLGRGNLPRYYASFRDVEGKDGCILSSITGNGDTEGAAIADYARNLSGQLCVYKSHSGERREFWAPFLIYAP